MVEKIIRGLILVALIVFYVGNLYYNRANLYDAIVFNRINFLVLVAILYLAADYIDICMNLCILVLIGGLFFHGYMYYNAYVSNSSAQQQTKEKNCYGEGSTWYSKLNDRCY